MKSDHKDTYMKAKFFTKETIQSLGQYHRDFPNFSVGDTIAVSQWVKEGDTKRIQIFEGIVLARKHGKELGATITVRKISNGIGVEKIYPIGSPLIDKIEIKSRIKSNKSKLYYLRSYKKRLKKVAI